MQGNSSDVIPTLEGPFDLVFIDHWKPLYLPDLQAIERHGLLRSGSIVVADNVGEVFGAEEFLRPRQGQDPQLRQAVVFRKNYSVPRLLVV